MCSLHTSRISTLPELTFFVINVTSAVPLGPGPTSHTWVSSASPGDTGAVNFVPKNFSDRGSLLPISLMRPRAANPNVDKPCKITPRNPTDLPTFGSTQACFSQFPGGLCSDTCQYGEGCNHQRDDNCSKKMNKTDISTRHIVRRTHTSRLVRELFDL
jgi:hypothetical protein